MEDLKNKIDEVFEKSSKEISLIMLRTNWKVETVDVLFAGASTTISLRGDKHKVIDLVWMSKRRHGDESFTTNVRTAGSFELLAGKRLVVKPISIKNLDILLPTTLY